MNSVRTNSCGEEVSTVRKFDFSAAFNRESSEVFDRVTQDIHHADFITKSNDNVKSTWMESYSKGFVKLGQLELHFQGFSGVIPDLDERVTARND
jgi:hypothetical protein